VDPSRQLRIRPVKHLQRRNEGPPLGGGLMEQTDSGASLRSLVRPSHWWRSVSG